jgi:hypothetical protein
VVHADVSVALPGLALSAAAAIWCLWVLVPNEVDLREVLPGAVAFFDAQRSGPVLPDSIATLYPWLKPSAGGERVAVTAVLR